MSPRIIRIGEVFEAEANSFVAKTALEDYIGKNYKERSTGGARVE